MGTGSVQSKRALLAIAAVGLLTGVSTSAQSARAPKTQLDGVYTLGQAGRGAALFQEQCESCHNTTDRTDLRLPAPIVGRDFLAAWSDLPLSDLVNRIVITMPKQPRPVSAPPPPPLLTQAQAVDLVAYILWLNGAPYGQNELPSTRDGLRAIMFTR